MAQFMAVMLFILLVLPVCAKEGISLLTPDEAEALRATLPANPQLPFGVAEATDEELWDYVPQAAWRRAVFLGPNEVGCPVHGLELFRVGGGFYPWVCSDDKPWQVKCPVGGETYPSNDFAAFLQSGMQDQSLLTGDYPDDGNGWVDAEGRRFFFVGYWVFHQRWYDVLKAITALSDAYFATGQEAFARRATLLFCALAEQYPYMNFATQSTMGDDAGMILPWCWENQSVVTPMATAYDRLFPYLKAGSDRALNDFVQTKTDLDPRRQIEQRFMQTVARTEFTTDNYWSNELDHQLAFADWALAWDNNDPADGVTTQQAIDWIIHDGGSNSLDELLYNSTYRDGFPCEGAIGYSQAIAERQLQIADRLKRCGYDVFQTFPRLKQVASCWLDMTLADNHVPSIGDGGSVAGALRAWSAPMLHLAWENYRDPQFAQALWEMQSMRRAPYTPDRTEELRQAIQEHGERPTPRTRNLGGMGLAILEAGDARHRRGLTMYYGSPSGGHCHHDRLNIEFFDHGQSMLPELGYPDQWGAKAQQFTQNSLGHYAVLVDEQGEQDYMAGYLDFIKGLEGVQLVSARAERCFPGTSLYRRETALVDISAEAGYLFDVFRVHGGKQHDWSFHLPPVPQWDIEGVELSIPAPGTLAGENVPQGGEYGSNNGFNWLVAPQRGQPAGNFSFMTQAAPPYPALKMTLLGGPPGSSAGVNEIIVADHESPRVGLNLPPYMKWLLARRTGETGLSSAFAAVIEAFPEAPRILEVRRLPVTGGTEPVVVEVRTEKHTDLLFSDELGEQPVQIGNDSFQGRWGMVRQDAEGIQQAILVGGSRLSVGGLTIETTPDWRGKVTTVDYQANTFDTDLPLPEGELLKGEWVILSNTRHSTCYEIAAVTSLGQGSRIQLTEITPMVGKGIVERVEMNERLIHTDTRWRVFGRDCIFTPDFGPALAGYQLLNEDLSQGVEIEDCKLMPSRESRFFKTEPAWFKVVASPALDGIFRDMDGDGKVGWWVYDFGSGFNFRITNSINLRRIGPKTWAMAHPNAQVQLSLPAGDSLIK